MIQQGICAENVYVDSNAVEGVSFIADTTGTFRFTITSGAYSCWPSSDPDIGWYSGVIVYKNRPIDWEPFPGSPDTFYTAGADFVIGNTGTKYSDYASAEASGVGSYVDIPMNVGDYLIILTPDGKCGIVDDPQDECGYGDNEGGIYLDVTTQCDFSSEPSDPERCFGGVGSRCMGDAPGSPFVPHEDTCLVDGWMSVGSILHDRCCLATNNLGYSCPGLNPILFT
jgi:hypothetical protein